jgi:hypothetical protein
MVRSLLFGGYQAVPESHVTELGFTRRCLVHRANNAHRAAADNSSVLDVVSNLVVDPFGVRDLDNCPSFIRQTVSDSLVARG